MRSKRRAWCPAPIHIVLLSMLLFTTSSTAGLITITNGSTPVGTLGTSVNALFGFESAEFTLFPEFRGLMSDAGGNQFRFFQVIYYDDEPVSWRGTIITAAGAPAHTGTVVDVPAGGWDYQFPGGDDLSPFYESDTVANPATGVAYYFPTLTYPVLHSLDGTNPGGVRTEDAPGLMYPNHRTLFETYLVYVTPATWTSHTFNILAGFAWGIGTSGAGGHFGIDSGAVSAAGLAKLAELDAAMARSGYSGWTAAADALWAVPEPATSALIASGLAVLLLVWPRRR